MENNVTVLMPIGPRYNPAWFQEAFESVLSQKYPAGEVLLIDDGANLPSETLNLGYKTAFFNKEAKHSYTLEDYPFELSYWKCPCNLGFSAAFNLGMALARYELVAFLAHDDKMLPDCLLDFITSFELHNMQDAWYAASYIDSDGNKFEIPNNLAMITKGMWRKLGGIPPAGFVGPDALLLSCLIKHAPDKIIHVSPGKPNYWIRNHPEQETKIHTWRFVPEMNSIRDKITREFKFNE